MSIPPRDVLAVATAMLPTLLAKALPNGGYRFGGEYASPHPSAHPKRQRDYRADIVVNSKGAWRDNLTQAQGTNILTLLAHIQNKSIGAVGADIALSLNPLDALNGRAVPHGLTARSKTEDSGDADQRERVMLDAAALIGLQEGMTKAEALYQFALRSRKRKQEAPLAFNQLTTFADPTGTPIANCTLQAWLPGVWLATFTTSYATELATLNLFKGHEARRW